MGCDLAGPVTEDAELLVRPDRGPAAQIVLPATDAGDALGFHKAAAALFHLRLGALAHDHACEEICAGAQIGGDLRLVPLAPLPQVEDENPQHGAPGT